MNLLKKIKRVEDKPYLSTNTDGYYKSLSYNEP